MQDAPDSLPDDDSSSLGTGDWPHAPPCRLSLAGVYFVTARTAEQRDLLGTPERRDWFLATLFRLSDQYGWTLEAWAVLSNHYHLIAHSPRTADHAGSLGIFLRHLHSLTTKKVNLWDQTPGHTRLWQNFRDTRLTLQRGYLARLSYVHTNPAHHRLVGNAALWPWCSAAAFENRVTPAWRKTVYSFKYDQIAEEDGE